MLKLIAHLIGSYMDAVHVWSSFYDSLFTDPVLFQKFYDEQLDINEIWQLEVLQPNMKSKL